MNLNENNPGGEAEANEQNDSFEEVSKPLGVGDEFTDEDLSAMEGEGSKFKFNSGAMVVGAVVLIAAVGLFSMRTLTRASAADEAPSEIELLIEEFLPAVTQIGAKGTGRTSVLGVLNESYAERQVPLDEVQRNPFILFGQENVVEVAHPVNPGDPRGAQRRQRLAQFQDGANKLRVGMIMMGENPMANINNRVVRIGDMVEVDSNVSFRVVTIEQNRVDFIAEDAELELEFETSVSLRR